MPIDEPRSGVAGEPRDVFFTGRFKSDFKREKKGRHRSTIEAELQKVVDLLAGDHPLPSSYVDHPLSGPWKDHRDLHVKPDLVLIYRKIDPPRAKPPAPAERPKLHLVRLGSHSQLGL